MLEGTKALIVEDRLAESMEPESLGCIPLNLKVCS